MDKNNPPFKVGDIIRRVEGPTEIILGQQSVKVLGIKWSQPWGTWNMSLDLPGKEHSFDWHAEYYELVSRPNEVTIRVDPNVQSGSKTLDDGRVLNYIIEPAPWVPAVGDNVKRNMDSDPREIIAIWGKFAWLTSSSHEAGLIAYLSDLKKI